MFKKKIISKVVDECHANMVSVDLTKTQQSRSLPFGFTLLTVIRASKIPIRTQAGLAEIGLTSFQINFSLENGRADTSSFPQEIDSPLPPLVTTQIEHTSQTGKSSRTTSQIDGEAAVSATQAEIRASMARGKEQNAAVSLTQRQTHTLSKRPVVLTQVQPQKFTLAIENPAGDGTYIDQKIFDSRLCHVTSDGQGKPVTIRPSVQIFPRQIWRGSGTGVFGKQLHPNQDRLINRIIAKLVEDNWSLQSLEVKDE